MYMSYKKARSYCMMLDDPSEMKTCVVSESKKPKEARPMPKVVLRA